MLTFCAILILQGQVEGGLLKDYVPKGHSKTKYELMVATVGKDRISLERARAISRERNCDLRVKVVDTDFHLYTTEYASASLQRALRRDEELDANTLGFAPMTMVDRYFSLCRVSSQWNEMPSPAMLSKALERSAARDFVSVKGSLRLRPTQSWKRVAVSVREYLGDQATDWFVDLNGDRPNIWRIQVFKSKVISKSVISEWPEPYMAKPRSQSNGVGG